MEFSIKSGSPEKLQADCIVAGVFEDGKMSSECLALDQASGGYISAILARADMDGKTGSTLLLYHLSNVAAERVLLAGLGNMAEFGEKSYNSALRATFQALAATGAKNVCLTLAACDVPGRDKKWNIRQAIIACGESRYRFDKLKSKPEKKKKNLEKITLLLPRDAESLTDSLKEGEAIASGVKFAKDIANLPGNICTPTHLAEAALDLAKSSKLKASILEEKDMEELGMGSLLSVAQGSYQAPKMIVLEYQGAGKKAKPVVLVGKGVTFDSGGISLKPGADMDEMKYDMCGAASVLGTMKAVAALKLAVNVVAIIPATENMPGGGAVKPGDIVQSMSGQTIEILNTDAEGRLILCDALTYAERFSPATVIDIATLTGACVISLGHVAAGLFANNETLAAELLAAADSSGDKAWRLPLWDDYQEQLKSNFADMANIGGRPAGSITAACFLSRFTKKYDWAHLDIAGVAHLSGKHKGATGRPVALLTEYLIGKSRSGKSK